MNKYFKKLMIEENQISCYGDSIHNEYIEVFTDCKEDNNSKKLSEAIQQIMDKRQQSWVFHSFNKWELQRMKSLLNSKTEKTFNKRFYTLIHKLLTSGMYSHIFNRCKIDMLCEVFNKEI